MLETNLLMEMKRESPIGNELVGRKDNTESKSQDYPMSTK